MLTAINDLMLDILAAVARKDYQDRRRKQKKWIAKAKPVGYLKVEEKIMNYIAKLNSYFQRISPTIWLLVY